MLTAEILKLRRRRGLMTWSAVLTFGLVGAFFLFGVLQSGSGPAGGVHKFTNCINGLGVLGSVAAIMIGATAGAGDRGAGVLRDLVATGVPRWRLFATRVPAVVALVVPLALAATLAAALLANGLRSGLPAVGAGLAVKSAAWVAAAMVVNGALAVGVASLLGSQSTSIGLLLGWHLAASHLLVQVGALGDVRWWLPLAALDRLEPHTEPLFRALPIGVAVAALLLWPLVWGAAGMWRTVRADV